MWAKAFLYLIFLVMLLPVSIVSASSGFDQSMSEGKKMLDEMKYEDAAQQFRAAVDKQPNDYLPNLYLGMALSRSGNMEAERYLKKALMINPSDPQVNYEMGVFYYQKKIYAESRDYFETVIETAPSSDYALKSRDYLKKFPSEGPKSYISAAIGGQYDSNVILNGDGSPLPQNVTKKSDWKTFLKLNGRFYFLQKEKMNASIGYVLYQSLHSKLTDYNITQNLIDVSLRYKMSSLFTAGIGYGFEHVFVGGDVYDYANSISPSVKITRGNGFDTEIDYKYRYTHFKNSELFSDNSDRTGANNSIRLRQSLPLSDAVRAEIGYVYDRENARVEYWKYNGNKVFASLNFPLFSNLGASIYAEYYLKDYDGINPVSGSKRKDKVSIASFGVTKSFSEKMGLTLGETYIMSKSNIQAYDYNRYLTTILLHARF